ncbi:MAG: E3 ubiquitin ligase family protein [Crocinitomicaceae bacterium]|nr:E3 ubiquitin ligase family protein [Crocinitomicaceae bacterium]
MGIMIGGAVVALIGLVLWILMNKRKAKMNVMDNYENTSAAEIIQNHQFFEEEYGKGSFSNFIEIRGNVHCESPIQSEFAKENVVYYKSIVTREIEKQVQRRDSNGNVRWDNVRSTEKVSENERKANFYVKDQTGEVLVDPEGAELHTMKIFSEYEAGSNPSGNWFNFGGFSFGTSSGTTVLGYKYEEYAIPMNSHLYVLGEANDRAGKLRISKSTDKKQHFIVSTKTEDELKSNLQSNINIFKWSAIALWIIGAGLVVFGVTKMI